MLAIINLVLYNGLDVFSFAITPAYFVEEITVAESKTFEANQNIHEFIFSQLREQLITTYSLINYCEDIETTSLALIDYLNQCKDSIYAYIKKENSITLVAEDTKQELEKQINLFYRSIEKIVHVQELSHHATDRMSQVDQNNQEIVQSFEAALQILKDISFQTKILAINSSIEAARIREGSVFKIISKEVQKLSETTSQATQNMSGSTQTIKEQSKEMHEILSHTHATLQESVTHLLDGKAGFQVMLNGTETVVKESLVFDELLHQLLDLIHKSLSMVEFNKISYTNVKQALVLQAKKTEEMLERLGQFLPEQISLEIQDINAIQKNFYEHFKKEDRHVCKEIIREALEQGFKPEFILTHVVEKSVESLGREQVKREVPLSEIYMNGKIIEEALDILLPLIPEQSQKYLDTIVIGNAFGDYHALGRKIVSTFLKLAGFKVIDLGNSVSNEQFVKVVKETNAKLVCVSALIIHTAKEVINLRKQLNQAGLQQVKILVGGAPFNFEPRLAEEVQATGMARNAVEAIRVAKQMLGIYT